MAFTPQLDRFQWDHNLSVIKSGPFPDLRNPADGAPHTSLIFPTRRFIFQKKCQGRCI